jgi:hypothetical protein
MCPEGPISIISTQMFFAFPSFKQMLERFPEFQVATACFSYNHPELNSPKFNPLLLKSPNTSSYATQLIRKEKFKGPFPRDSANIFTNINAVEHCSGSE